MNQETLIEIGMATIRRRWPQLLLLCAITYALAVLIVRNTAFPYTAQMRMYAVPQASQTIFDGQASSLMGMGNTERTMFLSSQDSLLRSNRIFSEVQSADPELRAMRPDSSTKDLWSMVGEMQKFFFGEEYVKNRQKWKNREIALFKQRISSEVDLDSGSIAVRYKNSDPEVAMQAVRAAAAALQELNTEIAKSQDLKKIEFLRSKIEQSQMEVEELSNEITSFVRKHKFSSDPRIVDPTYKGFADSLDLLGQLRLEISQRSVSLEESKRISKSIRAELKKDVVSDRDGKLGALTNELRQYELALSKTPEASRPSTHAKLKREIALMRNKIGQEFSSGTSTLDGATIRSLLSANEAAINEQEVALRALERKLPLVEEQKRVFEKKLSKFPELNAKLSKLTSSEAKHRKVLDSLTQRYLEAQINFDTKNEQLYITEEPTLTDTDKLGKLPILCGFFVVMTILSISILLGFDLLRGVLLTKQQLLKRQVPQYIGSVPFEPKLRMRRPYSVVTETGLGFRLAHSVKRIAFESAPNKGPKVIAVSSKSAQVGKTVTAIGIAVSMHSRGLKTLIIDADYLAQDRSIARQLSDVGTHISNIGDLLNSSGSTVHPIKGKQMAIWSLVSMFSSEELLVQYLMTDFPQAIEKLKGIFECIVIDTAPCFISSMLLIYEQADLNILCFAEGKSTDSDVEAAMEIVGPSCKDGAKILSALTIARLKSNATAPQSSDSIYYRSNRTAA